MEANKYKAYALKNQAQPRAHYRTQLYNKILTLTHLLHSLPCRIKNTD